MIVRKIYLSEINSCVNKLLARDVYYNGRLIVKGNSIISKYVITRLTELQDQIECVYIYDNYMGKDIVDENYYLHNEIRETIRQYAQDVYNKYSYTTKDDLSMIENIFNLVLDRIFKREYYIIYHLENMFFISKKLLRHTVNVTAISIILAVKMGVPAEVIVNMGVGALLHDIGLLKLFIEFPNLTDIPHDLNYEEFQLYKSHPFLGYNEILYDPMIPPLSKHIILYHHVWENFENSYNEYYDTHMSFPRYYNDKLVDSKNKNDLLRIVQIADFYDSTIGKCLKKHMFRNNEHVLDFIKRNKNNIFGGDVADVLLASISKYSIGDKVVIFDENNNKKLLGNVIKHTSNVDNPIIKLTNDHEINLLNEEKINIVSVEN